jgi:hypothetical protein
VDGWGLVSYFLLFRVDQSLLFVWCRQCELVRLRPTLPRCGAFGLRHHGTLKEGTQLLMGSPSLRGQWFEHRLEEDCHSGNVLARLSKEWWMITTIVIIDVPVDIASPASSHATVIATSERCAQLHQLLLLLLELPL